MFKESQRLNSPMIFMHVDLLLYITEITQGHYILDMGIVHGGIDELKFIEILSTCYCVLN